MKTDLAPDQISFYRENGYLIFRNLLGASELAEIKEAVMQAVSSLGNRKVAGRDDWLEQNDYYDRVFVQRINLWKLSPVVKKTMIHRQLGRMLCSLAGVGGIRLWHDQALMKAPWANPTSLHVDAPYWSFSSRHAISIWIALDKATLQNGCMVFLPGSHKVCDFTSGPIGPEVADIFKTYPGLKHSPAVPVELEPGDCSFHNGLLVHGAGANLTPGWRRALTAGYMPEGSTFNGQRNILSVDQVDRIKIGDLLEEEEQNPLLYSAPRVPERAAGLPRNGRRATSVSARKNSARSKTRRTVSAVQAARAMK